MTPTGTLSTVVFATVVGVSVGAALDLMAYRPPKREKTFAERFGVDVETLKKGGLER